MHFMVFDINGKWVLPLSDAIPSRPHIRPQMDVHSETTTGGLDELIDRHIRKLKAVSMTWSKEDSQKREA